MDLTKKRLNVPRQKNGAISEYKLLNNLTLVLFSHLEIFSLIRG